MLYINQEQLLPSLNAEDKEPTEECTRQLIGEAIVETVQQKSERRDNEIYTLEERAEMEALTKS